MGKCCLRQTVYPAYPDFTQFTQIFIQLTQILPCLPRFYTIYPANPYFTQFTQILPSLPRFFPVYPAYPDFSQLTQVWQATPFPGTHPHSPSTCCSRSPPTSRRGTSRRSCWRAPAPRCSPPSRASSDGDCTILGEGEGIIRENKIET